MEIEINDSHGYQVATAEASRFVTLPEDPSQTERQNAYVGMLSQLMNELTKDLTASISPAYASQYQRLDPSLFGMAIEASYGAL